VNLLVMLQWFWQPSANFEVLGFWRFLPINVWVYLVFRGKRRTRCFDSWNTLMFVEFKWVYICTSLSFFTEKNLANLLRLNDTEVACLIWLSQSITISITVMKCTIDLICKPPKSDFSVVCQKSVAHVCSPTHFLRYFDGDRMIDWWHVSCYTLILCKIKSQWVSSQMHPAFDHDLLGYIH
jgi:hypothetical protein